MSNRLAAFYRRHRGIIWRTLILFFLYLVFLVFYALPFNYADLSGLAGLLGHTPPPLVPAPLETPGLSLFLAALLGHLRFALLLVLPLLPFALLHLLAVGLYSLLSIPRRPFRPNLRPYLYSALLALALYYLPGLPLPGVYASGNPKQPEQKTLTLTTTKLFLPSLGGCLTTPDLMATLCIPPGALAPPKPALITLRSIPHTLPAPGPVPEQATLIAAAELWRHNPYDEENDYFSNFFRPPATLRLSLKHAIAPAKNSTHYTEVCTWFGEEGTIYGFKNYWHCRLSDIGPGTDRKGQGYIEVYVGGLDSRHQNYYVFQFPKEWANQNCLEAGGTINPNIPAIDFHSFSGACYARPPGTRAQIGELKAPESMPLFRPPPASPTAP